MAHKRTFVQKIVDSAAKRFPSFGGGKTSDHNPIAQALKYTPPQFAAGVDIKQVVRFVLAKQRQLERAAGPGDDARDYMNTSYFLNPLSNKALTEIGHLGPGDIRRHLKEKTYPFSKLSTNARETLLYLPNSWTHGAAEWLLNARKHKRTNKHQKT